MFNNAFCGVVDPKQTDERNFVDIDLEPRKHDWVKKRGETLWVCKACGDRVESKGMERSNICPTPDHILIPPNSFCLGESLEEFDIPRDVLAVCLGKSTYARCGLIVNVTPLEPEWVGKVTIEISNTTPLPARVYAGEGIMQVLFLRCDGLRDELDRAVKAYARDLKEVGPALASARLRENLDAYGVDESRGSCQKSYADKAGKYQNQGGLTLPEVDK